MHNLNLCFFLLHQSMFCFFFFLSFWHVDCLSHLRPESCCGVVSSGECPRLWSLDPCGYLTTSQPVGQPPASPSALPSSRSLHQLTFEKKKSSVELSASERQSARRGPVHLSGRCNRWRPSVLSTHFLVMATFIKGILIYNSFISEQVSSVWLEQDFLFYNSELILLPACKYFSVCWCLRTESRPPFFSGFSSLSTFAVVLCRALRHLTVWLWQVVLVKGERKECTAAVAGLIKRLASDYLFSTCVTNFPHFLNACAHGPEFTHSCPYCQVLIIDDIWLGIEFFLCKGVCICLDICGHMEKVFNSNVSTFITKCWTTKKFPYIRENGLILKVKEQWWFEWVASLYFSTTGINWFAEEWSG